MQCCCLARSTLEFSLGVEQVRLDDLLLFAVRHDEFAGIAEEVVELLGIVDQHVARARTKEKLDGSVACGVNGEECVDILVGGTEHEPVVDRRIACREGFLAFEGFERGGLWIGVGHVDDRGHTTGACGAALAIERSRGILGIAAVAEMHMRVDHSRQKQKPLCINYLRIIGIFRVF